MKEIFKKIGKFAGKSILAGGEIFRDCIVQVAVSSLILGTVSVIINDVIGKSDE